MWSSSNIQWKSGVRAWRQGHVRTVDNRWEEVTLTKATSLSSSLITHVMFGGTATPAWKYQISISNNKEDRTLTNQRTNINKMWKQNETKPNWSNAAAYSQILHRKSTQSAPGVCVCVCEKEVCFFFLKRCWVSKWGIRREAGSVRVFLQGNTDLNVCCIQRNIYRRMHCARLVPLNVYAFMTLGCLKSVLLKYKYRNHLKAS